MSALPPAFPMEARPGYSMNQSPVALKPFGTIGETSGGMPAQGEHLVQHRTAKSRGFRSSWAVRIPDENDRQPE
jgi:hypothetical protein